MKPKTKPKAEKPQTWKGYQPPPPGGSQGYMEGSRASDPLMDDVIQRWQSLKTEEAMSVFAERWVSLTANQFERTWPVLYQMLKFIETHELYKDATKTSDRKCYDSFQSYFEAKVRQQFVVWSDLEVSYRFAIDHCPELLERPFAEANEERRKRGGQPGNQNASKNKAPQKTNTKRIMEAAQNQIDTYNIFDKKSNQTQAQRAEQNGIGFQTQRKLDHLAKQSRTTLQLVANGELTVAEAERVAGIAKEEPPLKVVERQWHKATPEDKRKIVAWIQEQLQNDPELLESLG